MNHRNKLFAFFIIVTRAVQSGKDRKREKKKKGKRGEKGLRPVEKKIR
jgi:hypothetical protein